MPIIGVALMIVAFGVLIMGHEAGHWLTARLFGFNTPVFSIGFGPRQIKIKLFGRERTIPTSLVLGTFWKTEFRLSPIPLGGYVAIPELGDETSDTNEPDPAKTRRYSIWKRAVVASAGVIMNVIMAVVIIFALYSTYGEPYAKVTATYASAAPLANSVAAKAGFEPGDVFVSVDGTTTTTPEQLVAAIKKDAGKPATIVLRRNGQEQTVVVVPGNNGQIGLPIGASGVRAFQKVGTIRAFKDALHTNSQMLTEMTKGIGMMLHVVPRPPSIPAKDLAVHGPVGLVSFGASAYSAGGLFSLLLIVAVISLNLALLNILPIPGLDGGHLLFLAIEKLRGKPIPREVQWKITYVFFGLLLLLMALALFNDVTNPIGK